VLQCVPFCVFVRTCAAYVYHFLQGWDRDLMRLLGLPQGDCPEDTPNTWLDVTDTATREAMAKAKAKSPAAAPAKK
jgi:hypothetical protein